MMKRSHKSQIKGHGFISLFLRYSLVTVHFLLLLATVAFASEGGGEESVSVLKAYLWPVINFLILVGVMAYVLK